MGDENQLDKSMQRRTALKSLVATVSTGTIGGLAGCADIMGGGGGGNAGGEGSSANVMQNWMADPEEFALDGGRDLYRYVAFTDFDSVRDQQNELDNAYRGLTKNDFTFYDDFYGIEGENLEWKLDLGQALRIAEANYNTEDVVEVLNEREFEREDEEQGFTILGRGEDSVKYLLDGSIIIGTTVGNFDGGDPLDTILGIPSGETDLWVTEDEDIGHMVDQLNGDHVYFPDEFDQPSTEEVSITAVSATFNGESTDRTLAAVYNDEISQEDLETVATRTEWANTSANIVNETIGVVTGEESTSEFQLDLSAVQAITGEQDPPQASLLFKHDGDADVIIKHEGGDLVSTDNISVGGDGNTDSSFDVSEMTRGDTITTDEGGWSEGDEVNIVWSDPNIDRQVIIASGTASEEF